MKTIEIIGSLAGSRRGTVLNLTVYECEAPCDGPAVPDLGIVPLK